MTRRAFAISAGLLRFRWVMLLGVPLWVPCA